jgi:hypothetical protein
MNEPIWKLLSLLPTQQTQVVWREWPDGRQESCLVTAEPYLAWHAEGNEPLPPDDPVQQNEQPETPQE